jgi:hypothetical protein
MIEKAVRCLFGLAIGAESGYSTPGGAVLFYGVF